jgi:hypothetical protein
MNLKSLALIAGCFIAPAIASAQTGGLTRVQLLALQQQLKEECGLRHATGVMDGPTRHAIAVCNRKYGTHGNGAALLRAMNIGYSDDISSTGMGSVMGSRGGSSTGISSGTSSGTATRTPVRARRRVRPMNKPDSAQTDSIMRADRDAHGHDQGRPTRVRDTAYSAVADSLARTTKGLPAGPTKPKAKTKH